MMIENRNANGPAHKSAAVSGQALWRNLMACPCPPRQIRQHLFFADIFAWVLIILAAVAVCTLLL
jgi:hypothetical protein